MHIAIALRRRVRLFRLGAREGFEKKHQELAADLEPREGFEFFAHRPCPATQGSTFSARSARRVREKARGAGRSARGFEFSGWRGDQSKKSKNFWARKNRFPRKTFKSKNSFFPPPAPKCIFDRSGARRVRVFCTSSVPCDAGFDFFGSECAKGSRNKHLELAAAPEGSEFRSLNERKTREFPRFFRYRHH